VAAIATASSAPRLIPCVMAAKDHAAATRELVQESQSSQAHVVRFDPALDALIAPGTPIDKVAGNFTFTEGPMWHEGRLWISDVAGDKTYAISADGNVQMLLDKSGGYNNPPRVRILAPMPW
jgi:hypothetical protein